MKEDHEKNKEELKCQLEQQLEGYCEDIQKKVSETNEKIKTTIDTIVKAQEEIISKIKAVDDDRKNRMEELHITTTVECQRNKQEVLKKLEERHKEIQTDISDRCLLYTSRCV